jgi:hypothetical protein
METFFRYFARVLLLALAPSCLAQVVTIRVISAVDGRPLLRKQHASVSLLYDKEERTPANYEPSLSGETDAHGEMQIRIPKPAPAHFSVMVNLTSEHWRCGCWVVGVTQDLIQKGIVGPQPSAKSEKSDAAIKAVPGEILILARPLSFLERLFYPFMKG